MEDRSKTKGIPPLQVVLTPSVQMECPDLTQTGVGSWGRAKLICSPLQAPALLQQPESPVKEEMRNRVKLSVVQCLFHK